MAIELEIQIVQPVDVAGWRDEVARTLREWFVDQPRPRWSRDAGTLGTEEWSCSVTSGVDAEVSALCCFVGDEAVLEAEAGWWTTIAVVERTPGSVLLMFVLAASLSRLTGAPVIDEAGLLASGRVLEPQTIESEIRRVGAAFDAVASRFAW